VGGPVSCAAAGNTNANVALAVVSDGFGVSQEVDVEEINFSMFVMSLRGREEHPVIPIANMMVVVKSVVFMVYRATPYILRATGG
jgi:hypothetical protein